MKILIIGAAGSLAHYVINDLLENTNCDLILFLRNAYRLNHLNSNSRITIIEGDIKDNDKLQQAMKNIDVVYVNISGEMELLTKLIIDSMIQNKISRGIFINTCGIYNEINLKSSFSSLIEPYKKAAQLIENSSLNYTIIRPCWFSNKDEINYEITYRNDKFKNPNGLISRKSIADLVRKCIVDNIGIRDSLGINPKK